MGKVQRLCTKHPEIPIDPTIVLYSWIVPDRECVIDGKLFTPRREVDKTCSLDCQIQLRRKLSRERAARHYKPRPLRPDATCEGCGTQIPAPKSGPMPRWCRECRATKEDERARKRVAVRRCHKCNTPVPDAIRKPGVTVCDDCRVDPRKDRQAHERRRVLRTYGITQEQFDQALIDQEGRCPGCRTEDPGAKGWQIEHDHRTGRFRGLFCMRCNTTLGLVDENPQTLRTLADWLEQQNGTAG